MGQPYLGLSPGFRVDSLTVALQSILKEQITGNVSPNGLFLKAC
jgi:hypothetical protein